MKHIKLKYKEAYIYLQISDEYPFDYRLYTQRDKDWTISFEYDWDEWIRQTSYNPMVEDPPKKKDCYHNWKEYIGFTEKYWYCETCDAKSKEDPNYKPRF